MIGQTFGGYRLISQLGEGGMGAVYLAEHMQRGGRMAIKVLLPSHSKNPEMLHRFFNEAKAAGRIDHPGIVTVYDFGNDQGRAYIVMELLQGESLAQRLKRGRLSEAEVITVARQLADALAVAHDKGIIHRDLKPDNIFLVPSDDPLGYRAKILDFGIAKLTHDAEGRHTQTGALLGTPLYMSPEQCRGAKVDQRADIYSLGCIVYEMLAGRTPFLGPGLGQLLAAHIQEKPPAILNVQRRELVSAIEWALAKDANDRPQRMADFADAMVGQRRDYDAEPTLKPMPNPFASGASTVLLNKPNAANEFSAPQTMLLDPAVARGQVPTRRKVPPKPTGNKRGGIGVALVAIVIAVLALIGAIYELTQ